MDSTTRSNRRQFLSLAAGAAALPGLTSCSSTAQRSSRWFEISLAQWSLHRRLMGRAEPKLDPLEFPREARRLGLNAIEYVNTFYRQKLSSDLLIELRKRCEDEGVKSLLIMCDGEGALGDPDETKRITAVSNHYKWVDAAAFLGCHSIRVNAQSAGSREEQSRLAADGLRRLTEYASKSSIAVIVENHGGLSSDGSWLAATIRRIDLPNCGTLPDFGNFRVDATTEYDRYRGVAELMPFAKGVSAKSYDFDASGNETTIDYRRMLDVVLAAGYRGHIGIEYEGSRLSEEAGIRATKALLERVRAG